MPAIAGRAAPNRIDLTGLRFGRLLIVGEGATRGKTLWWKCCCDCGTSTEVRGQSLRTGVTRSCGCLSEENRAVAGERTKTHGMGNSREYTTWCRMKDRCTNPAAVSAEHYHDKGIGFCERWSSFDAFFSDMGAMPDGASLDRIDNSKGYEPGNCRWATRKTQAQNRSVTRWVTAYGRTLCLADWATLSGCKYGTLYKRIVVLGQHPEAAISERAGRSWEIEEVGRSADPLPSDGIPALGGDA